MADHVASYLKPIISKKQYKFIRSHNFQQKNWNNIERLINYLLDYSENIDVSTLKSHFNPGLLFACRGKFFLTETQNHRLEALVVLRDSNPIDTQVAKQSKEIIKNPSKIKEAVINNNISENSEEDLYLEYTGKVQLKTILMKRLHICLSAEKRKLDFNLEDDDIRKLLERKTCYYTGARFSKTKKFRRTIDRVDNTKGYIKGNVVACTHAANQLKNVLLEAESEYKITTKQFKMFASRL